MSDITYQGRVGFVWADNNGKGVEMAPVLFLLTGKAKSKMKMWKS